MKIVKLNRRFSIHRDHGFQVGLKFDSWFSDARHVEALCKQSFGKEAWGLKYPSLASNSARGDWLTKFGQKRTANGSAPFWIFLRNESMLTMLMLGMELND
jgi:hypothetical protein